MAEPKDDGRQCPQDESPEAEGVDVLCIASSQDPSSDSSPVKEPDEGEKVNVDSLVDRTGIEERLGEMSVKVSPEEQDCKEPCCTDVDASPPHKVIKKKDIDDCVYHLKWIMWHDRKTPIVTQNENGPCPLIAISNILLLRGKIILPTVMEIVTAKQLMEYIGDMILQNVPKVRVTHCMPLKQSVLPSIARNN
jgi:hypothetical protein